MARLTEPAPASNTGARHFPMVRDWFASACDTAIRALLLLLALFRDCALVPFLTVAQQGMSESQGGNADKQEQATSSNQYTPPAAEPRQSADDTPQAARRDSGGQQQGHRERYDAPLWYLIVQTFVGIALVAFTLGQVIVGNWQSNATENQYKAMLEQNAVAQGQLQQAKSAIAQTEKIIARMELEQRPWLSLDEFEIRELEVGKQPVVSFSVTNSGKIPATIDYIMFHAGVFDWTEPFATLADVVSEIAGPTLVQLQGSSVPPGRTYRVNDRQVPTMTAELLADLHTMKQAICVIGEIRYHDPSGQRFVTHGSGFYDIGASLFILDAQRMGERDPDWAPEEGDRKPGE